MSLFISLHYYHLPNIFLTRTVCIVAFIVNKNCDGPVRTHASCVCAPKIIIVPFAID